MKKRQMLITLLSLLFFSLAVSSLYAGEPSPDTGRYVKAYYPSKPIARMVIKSFDPTPPEVNYQKGFLVIFVTDESAEYLKSLGFTLEEHPDYTIFNQRAPMPQSAVMQESSGIPGYSCYQTVEETFQAAQGIVAAYPNLAQWIDVGDSWQKQNNGTGYDMWVLKLTSNLIAGDKPKLFITTAIHAREYTTAPLSLAFANYLVNNYAADADARWILDHNEVHLMLHANPDGRKKAEAGDSWRKNYNTTYCPNSRPGADLNRNFDYLWGGAGASTNKCDLTYRGAYAASEPETQAVQNYLKAIFEDHNGNSPELPVAADASGLYLDIHSYSELVLWPWGHTSTAPPNGTQLQTLGRKFAYFNGYTPQQAVGLYPTTGTTDDYGYGELGIASYCFELGTAFFQSCSAYENTILPDNLRALIYAAKVARAPYMIPAGPDVYSLSYGLSNSPIATISDTRYNNSNGTEPVQNIAAAEYYIDTPPWSPGATPFAFNAMDGSFDSSTEQVIGPSIDTSTLTPGEHIIYVRGQDADGNWGPVSAMFLNVAQPGFPTASFTHVLSLNGREVPFKDTSSDQDGTIVSWAWDFGDGATSTLEDPVHTYAANGTYNVSLTVTDNDGNSASTTSQVSVYWDEATIVMNNQTLTNLSGADGEWKYYKVIIPSLGATASNLVISMSGGSGDADLYTRHGSLPTLSSYDCRPYKYGNNETCSDPSPDVGNYYIGIYGYNNYSGVSLSVSYDEQ